MAKLRVLRLFGNPLEFLPEITPCTNLRHLSLANVRIEGDQALSTINVDIEVCMWTFQPLNSVCVKVMGANQQVFKGAIISAVCLMWWGEGDVFICRLRLLHTLLHQNTS
jgi:hypothetical protein